MTTRGAFLITGASGFLGTQLLQALRAQAPGTPVIAAGRTTASTSPERWWPLDLTAPTINLPAGVDTVLHLAGEKRDVRRMWAVNYEGTRRLVDAAVQAGVRRFVYLSSVGVYGASPHAGLVTETFPHTPRNLYETSKDAAEKCVRELCSRFGMECVVVQPSNVVGSVPGHFYPLLGLMRMVKKGWFKWFGDVEPWVNYVAVDDVAAAVLVAAASAPPGQTFIINTPERLSHVVRWISEELGVPAPQRRLPMWLGKAAARLGSSVEMILRRDTPINGEKFLELTNTTRYDGSAFMQVAGVNYPMGLQQAIRCLVQAYRREGKL